MRESDFINLALQAGILKTVVRQGWSLIHIQNPESVADHTFRTAFLAMILSAEEIHIDQIKVLKMAIVHEIGETVVGDIVYEHGLNTVAPLANKHKDERNAVQSIFGKSKYNEEYLELWEEWVAQKTPEAQFLKRVEKLEMAIQAYEYEQQGYEPEILNEFWENARKYIRGSKLEPVLSELERRRKKG